jgi:alkylation response protein AidB-like acyl-CoA dehydrogenase
MDFGIDERTEWLRGEARGFLAEHLTARVRERFAETGEYHDPEFHRALAGRGWIGAFWPEADGGLGWDRGDFDVLYEEMAAAGAPMEAVAVTHIIAETIRRVGTAGWAPPGGHRRAAGAHPAPGDPRRGAAGPRLQRA